MTPDHTLRLATLEEDLNASLESLRKDSSAVVKSRGLLEAALHEGRVLYGVNTGFGALKNQRVSEGDLQALQENLLRSHDVGMGEAVPRDLTRRMLRLKIHALGLGKSGVSLPVFERLLAMEAENLIPVVPTQGSLGASGDLAPLAHLALPLLGAGTVWRDSEAEPASKALSRLGWEPVSLAPKDGLALINGTQFMAAYACEVVLRARQLATTADIVAAMALEASRGSIRPFEEAVHELRPHPGHGVVSRNVRRLLEGSRILPSHADCDKVQDPYSIRCVPQVHGAGRDALAYMASAVETEINSVTDNPLVFEDEGGRADLISAGNFHGQSLALPLDTAAIAVAELASISERRTYLLIDGQDDLPAFLLEETGVQSGFMIPQYLAASLVSENKTLCHPASVDTIPTSRGQEDHVSMGAWGARKALRVLENAEKVLAVEALTAAQALDFRRPLRSGVGVEAAHACIREGISFRKEDESFQEDLFAALELVRTGRLVDAVEAAVGKVD